MKSPFYASIITSAEKYFEKRKTKAHERLLIQQNVHSLVIAVKSFGYALSKKCSMKQLAIKIHRKQLIHGLKDLTINVRT